MPRKRAPRGKASATAPAPPSEGEATAAATKPRARRAAPAAVERRTKPPARPRRATTPRAKPAASKPRAKPAGTRRKAATAPPPTPPVTPSPVVPRLTEEETIEDAKYQPRTAPKRVFEEERFLFPESYDRTRIRLLVKDPEWVFVHWDVDSKTVAGLRGELGERAMALTRLTLRVVDAENGGGKTILLPPGARSWYVRTDPTGPRSYRAELGYTLPSGAFRQLAVSNTVVAPRVGPSPERARLRRRFGRGGPSEIALPADRGPIAPAEAAGEPWRPSPERSDAGRGFESEIDAGRPRPERGGSSELRPRRERGGASDVHRR